VWALDYRFDQTADGRLFKELHVVDEFTREPLAMECQRRIDGDAAVDVLDRLVRVRGRAPEFIRCDNGPELTANALKDWCRFPQTGTAFIEPGSPWENHVRRVVQRKGPRRAVQCRAVLLPDRGAGPRRGLAPGLQLTPSTSALGMIAPARFAREWHENPESTRSITPGDPLESRRTPQDTPADDAITKNDLNRDREADQGHDFAVA
jgi:hypothetical protein